MMQLVIEIPEEIRLALINNVQLSLDQQSICDSCIKQAIINGTTISKEPGADSKETDAIRQELFERGDEMISFRDLVERFDEVEEYFKGIPWTLKQIYNNFNILIGEKPEDSSNGQTEILNRIAEEVDNLDPYIVHMGVSQPDKVCVEFKEVKKIIADCKKKK